MQTKLTLRLEAVLIEEAKRYAEKAGKSVSQMVADYFSFLIVKTKQPSINDQNLPPITRQLRGLLRDKKAQVADYYDHLESKYL